MNKVIIMFLLLFCLNTFKVFGQNLTELQKKDSILYYLNNSNIKFKRFVLKQIMYESSFLKSKLARLNNNVTGFRFPRSRKTYAIKKKYGYAVYLSIKDCILDYELFQNRFKGSTLNEYEKFLNKIYSKNKKTYSKKIHSLDIDRIYKNLQLN